METSFSDFENFNATQAFVATWEDVVPYTEGPTSVRLCCLTSMNVVPNQSPSLFLQSSMFTIIVEMSERSSFVVLTITCQSAKIKVAK